MKRFLSTAGVILVAAMILTLSGCERVMELFSSFGLRLQSIQLDDVTVVRGEIVELTVFGLFDDGSQEPITTDLTWETSDAAIATVTAGLVSAVSEGQAIITVTHEARRATFNDTAFVTVIPVPFVVDDFEVDQLVNWVPIADVGEGASSVLERTTEKQHGGEYSLRVTVDTGTVDSWGAGAIYLVPGDPVDISDLSGISVWLHPNGVSGSLIVTIEDEDGTQLTTAVDPGPTPFGGDAWVEISHLFSSMTIPAWAEGSIPGLDFTKVTIPQFTVDTGVGVIYLDDYVVY